MSGLPATAERLEEMRDQLQANRLTALYVTPHGLVELVAGADGLRIYVDGVEVPQGEVS